MGITLSLRAPVDRWSVGGMEAVAVQAADRSEVSRAHSPCVDARLAANQPRQPAPAMFGPERGYAGPQLFLNIIPHISEMITELRGWRVTSRPKALGHVKLVFFH